MSKKQKKRVTASAVEVDTNLRCMRIYPVENREYQSKTLSELKTVGIKLHFPRLPITERLRGGR